MARITQKPSLIGRSRPVAMDRPWVRVRSCLNVLAFLAIGRIVASMQPIAGRQCDNDTRCHMDEQKEAVIEEIGPETKPAWIWSPISIVDGLDQPNRQKARYQPHGNDLGCNRPG